MSSSSTCQDCKRSPSTGAVVSDCPYRMADGRHFTDYNTRCGQNQFTQREKLPSNYEYRMFLISNAEKLIQENRDKAMLDNRCTPCFEPFEDGTMLPEQSKQVCNDKSCSFQPHNEGGLGLGRKHVTQETKDPQAGEVPGYYPSLGAPLL